MAKLGITLYLLASSLCLCLSRKHADNSMIIIVRSQHNRFLAQQANEILRSVATEMMRNGLENVHVFMMHKYWHVNNNEAWAVSPVFHHIMIMAREHDVDWVLFVEDTTKIEVKRLIENLMNFDPKKDLFLGRAVSDKKLAGAYFSYPDFHSGWLLSQPLVLKLSDHYYDKKHKQTYHKNAPFELARFISELDVKMTNLPLLCDSSQPKRDECVTHYNRSVPDCGSKVKLDDVFFGVMTNKTDQNNGLKLIKNTWGKNVKNLFLYGNDPTPGRAKVKSRDCSKMMNILQDYFEKVKGNFKFLVLIHDDTVLGVSRLIKFLNCFDPNEDLYMGEKYGFRLFMEDAYGYISGGGGIVLTRPSVKEWLKRCTCPTPSYSYDQYLGSCMPRAHYPHGLFPTFSPYFHDKLPHDYPRDLLDNHDPISFHGKNETLLLEIYKEWFAEDDRKYEVSERRKYDL